MAAYASIATPRPLPVLDRSLEIGGLQVATATIKASSSGSVNALKCACSRTRDVGIAEALSIAAHACAEGLIFEHINIGGGTCCIGVNGSGVRGAPS